MESAGVAPPVLDSGLEALTLATLPFHDVMLPAVMPLAGLADPVEGPVAELAADGKDPPEEARVADPAYRDVAVRIVGIPAERFVDHGSVDQLRHLLRLDAAGIAEQIRETLVRLRAVPGVAKPAARTDAKTPAK